MPAFTADMPSLASFAELVSHESDVDLCAFELATSKSFQDFKNVDEFEELAFTAKEQLAKLSETVQQMQALAQLLAIKDAQQVSPDGMRPSQVASRRTRR